MIVQTSKGALSLSDATSVTLKLSPVAYVPKIVGLTVIALGIVAVIIGIREINGPGGASDIHPWWGWSLVAFSSLVIIWSYILGGFTLVKAEAIDEIGVGLWLVIGIMTLAALFSMGNAIYAIDRQTSVSSMIVAVALFAFAGLVWWSRTLVGLKDATVVSSGQRVTFRGLKPHEATRIAAGMQRAPETAEV